MTPTTTSISSHELHSSGEIKDEQVAPAGQPPKLWPLYLSHALVALGARTWMFLVPITLIIIAKDSFVPGALFIAAQTISTVAFCTSFGRRVDQSPNRAHTALMAAAIADVPIVLSLFPFLIMLLTSWDFNSGVGKIFYFMLLVFGSVEAIASAVLNVQIKKDWVV